MQNQSLNEEAIFQIARRIQPPEALSAYLDQACGADRSLHARVKALLGTPGDADRFLESPPSIFQIEAAATMDQTLIEKPGTQIGPYKLLQQIGEGGMGAVYMAEQREPLRRTVALKIIKPGMDTQQVVARFEAERQALAMMNHPNIAKVLDAGATESGRPYFVMELVKGIPITEYCDTHKLTTRQRLELLITICEAVQHAHQKGIIHRDLKPGNLLVELHDVRPVPKVVDFGIAKSTNQRLTERTLCTNFSQMIGTPLYMSPEQAQLSGLDVDTRSDVYSLGVLLYELITGTTPFTKESMSKIGFDEMRRTIQYDDPPRPSDRISTLTAEALSTLTINQRVDTRKLQQQVRNELDWVVMKALDKDRTRRYQTATAFAEDLQRYLNDEPVQACPPSLSYRLQKLTRRYRAQLATAAVILLTMITATAFSINYAYVANAARRDSDRERIMTNDQRLRAEGALTTAETERQNADQARKAAEKQQQLAEERRLKAEQLEADAVRKGEELQQNLFVADTRLVATDLEAGNVSRARKKLASHVPNDGQADRRSWEWYYLLGRSHDETDTVFIQADKLTNVQWSPDGRHIAFKSSTEINVANAESFKREFQLKHDAFSLFALAWSPDSTRIAYSVDWSGHLKIWDMLSQLNLSLDGHENGVYAVSWSPDGRSLASVSEESTLRVWDANSGECRWVKSANGNRISDVDWHPNGTQIATAGKWNAKGLKVWDAETGHLDLDLFPNTHFQCVRYLRDGKYLLAGTDGGDLICINSDDGTSVFRINVHAGAVNRIAISLDNRMAATAGADGLIRIWSLPNGQLMRTLRGHVDSASAVDWKPDGNQLVSSSNDGQLKLWNIREVKGDAFQTKYTSKHTTAFHSSSEGFAWQDDTHLNFNADSHVVFTADLQTGTSFEALHDSSIPGLPDPIGWNVPQQQIIAYLADVNLDTKIARPPVGNRQHGISFGWFAGNKRFWFIFVKNEPSQNGEHLFKRDGNKITYEFVVFAVESKTRIASLTTGGGSVAVATSHNGDRMAVYGSGVLTSAGGIWIHNIDLVNSSVESHLVTDSSPAISAAWSRDGKRIACANEDGHLYVWDVDAAKVILKERVHQGSTTALAWSEDGKRIACGSAGGLVRIIDSQSGVELLSLTDLDSYINQIEWSPNGHRIAAQNSNGKIFIWDATRGFEYVASDDYRREKLYETFAKAKAYYDDKKYDIALPLLDELLSVETEHIDGLTRRALIHQRLNQNELELADWTKVVRLDPKYANGKAWTNKGAVELTLGNSDEAIKSFTNAIDLEAQFLRYRNRAIAYAIQSKIELALADFKKAAELDPKHQETWTNLGSIQMRLGLAKEAIEAFTTAIAINPESAADSLAMLPVAYILDGQTKIGLHELETLFKENPSDLANLHLSIAYLSTGKFESYASVCKELLNRLKPGSADSEINTAVWICCLSPNALSDYAPLIQLARQLVEKKLNDQQYLLRLGSILLRAGQYQEAKIQFKKGLSFPFKEDVSSAPYLYLFALLKEHLGDHESAVKQFDEAEKQALLELGQYPRWNRKLAIQILGKEVKEIVIGSK